MFPELYALAMALSFLVVGAALTDPRYQEVLESLRAAIRRAADKQTGVTPMADSQFSRAMHAQARLPLDVVAQMDDEIQRAFHWSEILRLGMPKEARGTLRMLRMALRQSSTHKRSA